MDLLTSGVMAIIRLRRLECPDWVIDSLTEGGVRYVEITSDTPGCLASVERTRERGSAHIGVGTVLSADQARRGIDAGAEFLVTPAVIGAVCAEAARLSVPLACGAMTPTEVVQAHSLGSSVVKVFPLAALGGPAYVSALAGPLPHIPLLPTGGVTPELTRRYAGLGVAGVGVGSELVHESRVAAGERTGMIALARRFVSAWEQGVV